MKDILQFLYEVKSEFSKVVWPKYGEFLGATAIVLLFILAFAIYLFVCDFALSRLVNYILDLFGA